VRRFLGIGRGFERGRRKWPEQLARQLGLRAQQRAHRAAVIIFAGIAVAGQFACHRLSPSVQRHNARASDRFIP
jgi:hypothetical protein